MYAQNPLLRLINKLSPVKLLLLFYLLAIFAATLILLLPVTHKDNVHTPLIDILFTVVSALSVTGLTSVSIVDTYSYTGIFLLLLFMQLGAVGVMAIGTFVWIFLGKKIGIKERRLIMTDQNQSQFEGIVNLIIQIVKLLLTIELISFIILGTYYLQYYPLKEAYYHGLFSTISAITNCGFDITGSSLQLYKNDYFVQFVHMILIIFGAIGFPVWIEVKTFLFTKKSKRKLFRFSLFTKLTTLIFFILVLVGTLVIFLLDYNQFFANKSWHEILFYTLFQSVTTRSAGISTMDVSLLSEATQLFMSFLMFIGASPSSAGGGIRTTTFALVLIFVITYARGGKKIRIFKREIYEEDLMKAVTITLMAIFLIFVSTLIMIVIEPFPIIPLLFEVTSAFGTVGLSLGITGELTTLSKVILMLLMFIGRVGIITFLFLFQKNKQSANYSYPKEKIIIG